MFGLGRPWWRQSRQELDQRDTELIDLDSHGRSWIHMPTWYAWEAIAPLSVEQDTL
jgi:hypothetical protein